MRVFFALDLDQPARSAVEKWRNCAIPEIGRPVDSYNYHITLVFLGNLSSTQMESLMDYSDRVSMPPFNLVLDCYGYFPKPGIYWVGPSETPATLQNLVKQLRQVARRCGHRVDKRPHQPHITLYRNCKTRPPLPVSEPAINCRFDRFTLFESVSTSKGVRYHVLSQWLAE